MKSIKSLIYFLILSSFSLSAQLMNVRKWRASERDSLDKGMEMFDDKMYLRSLPIFEALLTNHPKEEFLKYTYAKSALYRSDKHEDSYKYFTEVYNNNKKVPDIQYDMALAALYNYKFDEASDYANQYSTSRHTSPEGKQNAEVLKRNISYAKYFLANPTNAKVTNVSAVNTEYDEYVPAITADESTLIFTYAGDKSIGGRQNEYLQPDKRGNYMEDIYISRKENGEFRTVEPLDSLNTSAPDAAISLSTDGSILFVYQDNGDGHGDIYQSVLNGGIFSKPRKLRGEVNSYSWDGHCALSPDGQTLYFSSERAGGFGGRDLYKATLLLPDSTWGNVVNLGDSVNTRYDDDAPFIHADGVTLYFSSKGHSSMGGYDIFRTIMAAGDSVFKKVENLGYPINSPADDIYFVMAANGNTGYYSSGKKDGKGMKDIYEVEPNFPGLKSSLYLVKGKVTRDNKGVEATIKIEITSKNNKLYNIIRSNSSTGDYLVTLPVGVAYQLTYKYLDQPEQGLGINAVDISGYMEKVNNVNFDTQPDVLASVNNSKLPQGKSKETDLKTVTSTGSTPGSTGTATESTNLSAGSTGTVAKTTQTPKETVASTGSAAKSTASSVETTGSDSKSIGTNPNEMIVVSPSTNTIVVSSTARNNVPKAAWDFTANPVTSTPLNLPPSTPGAESTKDFVPVNGPQAKSVKFAEKYGEAEAPDLIFRVQIAAVKTDKNVSLPAKLGKVDKLDLNDGFIRITVGGAFKTLGAALEHNKKVVKAGQKEGFIIALYQGKRTSLDDLEKMGLLK